MTQVTRCTIIIVLLMVQSAITVTLNPGPVIIPESGEIGTCPLRESRDAAIQNIRASVQTILQNDLTNPNLVINLNCGAGQWYLITHLNMSNLLQQCPSSWREYNTSGVRGCGRPETSIGSCSATFYTTSRQYNRVCGRAIGYQIGSTDAFGHGANGQTNIDSFYVYGVSVTHGVPRNHIWTLAAGLTEGGYTAFQSFNCPCSNSSHPDNAVPPSFVGNNYYCESGNPTSTFIFGNLYSSDSLWDGQQCEGQCCSNGKSPPWFSVELPNPTTDDIEVRICMPQASYDDVAIQLLELYVQ